MSDATDGSVTPSVSSSTFLGTVRVDSRRRLTSEQKAWPVTAAVSSSVLLRPGDRTDETTGPARFTLQIVPPAGKGPDEIAADLKPLFVALVECEAALGGTGLRFDPVPGGPGAMAFCVSATDPAGAAERLKVLRDIVNGVNGVAVRREEVEGIRKAAPLYFREAIPF